MSRLPFDTLQVTFSQTSPDRQTDRQTTRLLELLRAAKNHPVVATDVQFILSTATIPTDCDPDVQSSCIILMIFNVGLHGHNGRYGHYGHKGHSPSSRLFKPLLTHAHPTLMETTHNRCLPLARLFTSK